MWEQRIPRVAGFRSRYTHRRIGLTEGRTALLCRGQQRMGPAQLGFAVVCGGVGELACCLVIECITLSCPLKTK